MDDKDVKRPYLERNHEAKGPHVPKGLMGLIVLLMGLMGCSGEETGEVSQPETGTAIVFAAEQQKEQAVTRAGTPLKNYVQQFKVYGFKNMSGDDTNGYSDLQQVFPGYTVKWQDNSAATSTTNSSGWEYLNQQALGQTEQTIKYWDWSAAAYRFFAVTDLKVSGEFVGDDGAYEVTYRVDAEEDDVPYYSHLWFSTGQLPTYSDKQFGRPVQLVFIKPLSIVRFMFTFENPDDKLYTELTEKDFRPTLGGTIKRSGKVHVTYPLTGTAADAKETFRSDAESSGLVAFTQDYYESDDAYINVTEKPSTTYAVLPVTDQGNYTLSLYVNGEPQECEVPAIYMNWLPGYTYTYIFKIHVNKGVSIDIVQSAFTEWVDNTADHTVFNW